MQANINMLKRHKTLDINFNILISIKNKKTNFVL